MRKKKQRTTPKVSIVIATYNSGRTMEKCLSSVRSQNYPQEQIELIVADGGSTDSTRKIAKKFKARVINIPKNKQSAEFNKAFGIGQSTGEYILCIDHDNILPHNRWIERMLEPHLEHPRVVATEPLRYHYDKKLTLLDRYFALFGVNDPLPYYLGKADKTDYIHNGYNLLGEATDKGRYYLVKFDEKNPKRIPTLGANGFLIKRRFFLKSNHLPGTYFHIDINVDLVSQGCVTYAFIKDDIIHLTNSKLLNFLMRRKHFLNQYYMHNFQARRYSVFYKEDLPKLMLFIIYAVTIIKPLFDSLRGFVKKPDVAWFLHPVMCLVIVIMYGYTFTKGALRKIV